MKNLELNGEWTTQLELPQFAKLRNLKFFRYESSKQHLATLEKGLIAINFCDEHNLNPDPSNEQNATLQFIIENQNTILESLFEGLKSKIYPQYQEQVDVDDYNFPPLNSLDDLEFVLGIRGISITTNYKDGFAYYDIEFEFSGDFEHGIIISMHQLRVIGFCGMGDNDGKAVYEDMGYDYDSWLQEYIKNIPDPKKSDFKVHQKIPKYNKLKPWQKEENHDYLRKLIRNDEIDALKSLIENNLIDLEEKDSIDRTILCSAVSMNKKIIVQLFLSHGASIGNAIFECGIGGSPQANEVLKLLVEKGGNIDYLGYWKKTKLYNEIFNWVNTFQDISIEEKKESSERLEKYKKDFECHTNNIGSLIELGANPLNCDGENSTYISLLKERWREDYLIESGIIDSLDKLLNKK